MFKKAVLLSFLTALSGMSGYAGLLDDFREAPVNARAYAIRVEEGKEQTYPRLEGPDRYDLPIIAPSGETEEEVRKNLHSIFFVPFPELSDSNDLRKILPEDLAWQALDNFKIPAQNIGVSFLSQHYFKGKEKGIELNPSHAFIEDIFFGDKIDNIFAGLFHPTLKNNDVSEQGGWDKFWPVRLSHPSGKLVSPHQVSEFCLSAETWEEDYPPTIKGLPLSTEGQTASLWSLKINKEKQKAEVTFHLLVNDADHKILDEMCTNASSLKLKELPSYLEEKNFGWVPNNTHLQVLKRLFQK